MGGDSEMRRYAEHSTLWLLGQYLGWVEILRKEAQFLDFGTRKRNRALQEALGKVAAELATDTGGRRFAVFRTEQRGIGELMIAEPDEADTSSRTTTLGYAEFVQRFDKPAFQQRFSRLRTELEAIAREKDYKRLIRVQRALIDLVDELDPDRVRYPVLDTRGKLPLPEREPAGSAVEGCDRLARFIVRASEYNANEKDFPKQLLAGWAQSYGLNVRAGKQPNFWIYEAKGRRLGARLVLHSYYREPWLEIYASVVSPSWARFLRLSGSNLTITADGWRFRRSRKRGRSIANDLLRQLDRPPVQ